MKRDTVSKEPQYSKFLCGDRVSLKPVIMREVTVGGHELRKAEIRIHVRLYQGIVCIEKGVDFRFGHADVGSPHDLSISFPTTADANPYPSAHLLSRGPATLSTLMSCSSTNRT